MGTSATINKKLKRFFSVTPHMKYVYGFNYKYCKVENDVILIEAFHGQTIGDSGLVFAKEILRLYPGKYKVYFATNDIKKHRKFIDAIGLDVKLIDINTFKYAKILCKAKYIISNASLPQYFTRKKEQKYLQTWHGTPLKTLGKQMNKGIESMYNVQHNFIQATHLTFPNELTRRAIMDDYNLEKIYTGKVIMCGYPRNQVFLDPERAAKTRKKTGLEDKTVYAYMPTWRGVSNRDIDNTDYLNTVGEIFKKLDKALSDDQLFFVNFHPILKNAFSFKKYKHIRAFPEGVDTYDFLNSSDALVTDYSSVFFDYSITKKPIILFMYDFDQYMADRGTYLDVKDLPFRKIFDVDEFIDCVKNESALSDDYAGSDYYNEFFKYDSPDNAERLLDLFLNGNPGDFEIDDYSFNKESRRKVYKPELVDSESDVRTLARVACDDDSIVWLYRKWFNTDLGQIIHDKYNYDFQYVITTDTPPRTYIEQALMKLGNKSAARKIMERDIKRCFGELNIDKHLIDDYGVIEEGYRIKWKDAGEVTAEIENKDNGLFDFQIESFPEAELVEAAILDNRDAIITRRPLTDEEKTKRVITFDLSAHIEDMVIYNKESGTPVLICRDKEGHEKVYCFTNPLKERRLKKLKSAQNSECFFSPHYGEYDLPIDYYRTNLRRLDKSFDENTKAQISGFRLELKRQEIALLPYLDQKGRHYAIRIKLVEPRLVANQISEVAKLLSYSFSSKKMVIKAFLPNWTSRSVKGGVLVYDSKTKQKSIYLNAEMKDTRKGCKVKLELPFDQELDFESLKWLPRIVIDLEGKEYYLRIKCESFIKRKLLSILNIQSRLPGNSILFPLTNKSSILVLAYRDKTEYDDNKTRIKEFLALVFSFFAAPFFKKNGYYIVYEKFCKTAQDNSLYFFKYCMENLPEKERKKIFYVIDKKADDYDNIRQYDSQVIQFMSIKHMVYGMAAKLCISTDSLTHLYTWQTKPSFVYNRIHSKGVLFLQHGVTALKRVDQLFGKKGSSPMKYFVTTSPIEQNIVVQNFGYKKADAPMVGFARWDVLKDKKTRDNRFILIMPTWRIWLEDATEEAFDQSEYFLRYKELMTDSRFIDLLEKADLEAVLYLHPKFADHIESFRSSLSERVKSVVFGEIPLNELMMRCHMLITDYSSVCWDVLYMDKPVLFYQFDYDTYMKAHGSYIDMRTDLPCPRTTDEDELIGLVGECIDNDFTINEKYQKRLEKFFAFRDSNNSARTYKFLVDREELGI